jgi:hypothetical protein
MRDQWLMEMLMQFAQMIKGRPGEGHTGLHPAAARKRAALRAPLRRHHAPGGEKGEAKGLQRHLKAYMYMVIQYMLLELEDLFSTKSGNRIWNTSLNQLRKV